MERDEDDSNPMENLETSKITELNMNEAQAKKDSNPMNVKNQKSLQKAFKTIRSVKDLLFGLYGRK